MMFVFYLIGCILAAYLLNKKFRPSNEEKKRPYLDSPMLVIGIMASWLTVFILWHRYKPEQK